MYYEIEGTAIRLAGTMHWLPAAAPRLPDWVWNAYEWCEEIVLEHDLATVKDHIYLADGDSLERHFSAPLWGELKLLWPPNHNLGEASALKPWIVLMGLPMIGIALSPGVEPNFTQRARESAKPLAFLETLTEFDEIADGIPSATYEQALATTLELLPRAQRNFIDLHRAWLTRRVEEVDLAMLQSGIARMPQIASCVFDLRNERWLPRILARATSGKRTLVCVGAGHLPRANGLISLLERAGHRVRLAA